MKNLKFEILCTRQKVKGSFYITISLNVLGGFTIIETSYVDGIRCETWKTNHDGMWFEK